MDNEDLSRLVSLAEAIVAKPKNTLDWIDMMLNPKPPVPAPSEKLKRAIDFFKCVKDFNLEQMIDYAFVLEGKKEEPERRAGRSLRVAIQMNLLDHQRQRQLTEEETKVLDKTWWK
jgi:hypothetical protein